MDFYFYVSNLFAEMKINLANLYIKRIIYI